MSTPQESFVGWASGSPSQMRLKIFQVLDTLVYYHRHHNAIVPLACFQLPGGLSDNVETIESYVSYVGAPQLPQEIEALSYLRPDNMAQLPLLMPTLPTASAGAPLATMPRTRDHNHNYQYIRTEAHAVALWSEYNALNNKRGKTAGVPDSVDYPHDAATQLAKVGELVQATMDLTHMIDKQTKSRRKDAAGQLIDSARIRRIKAATNVEIELGCWKLFRALKNAQDGNIGILGWGGDECVKYEKFPTFQARFDAAKEVLKKSKASFDAMMQPDFVLRLAAAPNKEYGQKKTNMTGAQAKAGLLAVGQEALSTGKVKKESDGRIVAQGGQTVSVPRPRSYLEDELEEEQRAKPNKRRRTTETTSSTPATTQSMTTGAASQPMYNLPQGGPSTDQALQRQGSTPYNVSALAPRPPMPRYSQQHPREPSELGGLTQALGQQPQRRVYSQPRMGNPQQPSYGSYSRSYNRQPNGMLQNQGYAEPPIAQPTQAYAQSSLAPHGFGFLDDHQAGGDSLQQAHQIEGASSHQAHQTEDASFHQADQVGGAPFHQAQQVDPELQNYDNGSGNDDEENNIASLFHQYINATDDDEN